MTDYNPYETPEWAEDQRRREVLMRAAAEEAGEENPLDGISTQDLELLALKSTMPDHEREQNLLEYDAGIRWADEHPEFIQSQRNAHLLVREMDRLGLDKTQVESFDRAFDSLREVDLVDIDQYQERQLLEDVRVQRRAHRVGVLSAKRSAPTDLGGDGEPDYDKMTSAQLHELAMLAAAKGKFF
jgi:hypothetical protein